MISEVDQVLYLEGKREDLEILSCSEEEIVKEVEELKEEKVVVVVGLREGKQVVLFEYCVVEKG